MIFCKVPQWKVISFFFSKSWASLPDGSEGFYNSLPRVFKEECLVRSKEEDPEKQKERAQNVKGKSVAELSAITSLSEFPVPKPSIFDSAKRNKSKERSRWEGYPK